MRTNKPSTQAQYQRLYQQSITKPESFWADQAAMLDFYDLWGCVFEGNLETGDVKWFKNAKINVAYNCIDRHLKDHANDIAIIWEGNNPDTHQKITYQQLHDEVCRFANVLKQRGVSKGDRVCLYMPMIPEAAYAMLACARIGAIHSVVFGGFSPDALANRILDANCQCVITADIGLRGSKIIKLKDNVDKALEQCPDVHSCIVVKTSNEEVSWNEKNNVWYHDLYKHVDNNCPCQIMDAEDPLFILYTSGSTGKPKGVLHTTAGYLLYAAYTFKTAFDYTPGDVYWCTADVGWITGHSYILYGPLANRATTLMYEGVPNYPSFARFWEIIDKHQVNIFYTAPTAIRALMREGDEFVKSTKRTSLKILGTVGEPINPEVWQWYNEVVGKNRCPIIDTWWQTETGGFMLTPLAHLWDLKPGSATLPMLGIEPVLLDENNQEIEGIGEGKLMIKQSWPGQMRSIYGDHQRYIDTYLSEAKGYYCTGDAARRDEDGYYWITGRIDDVINVSGHRIGTAEVESSIVSHEAIAEAAVVGAPHEIKGEGLHAFVTVKQGVSQTDELKAELNALVKKDIGSFAKPEKIYWADELPKTRSGKIMRRLLRKLVQGKQDELGDISTLADSDVLKKIKV